MDKTNHISYLCSRCRYCDGGVLGMCIDCRNGSNFVEQRKPSDRFKVDYYNAQPRTRQSSGSPLAIEKVIFNPPATIVMWADGAKTVVKCCPDEAYDPEKGMAMAISKHMLNATGQGYRKVFKQWAGEYTKRIEDAAFLIAYSNELNAKGCR